MTPKQNEKVLEAFESVLSPVYAAPGQRPAMGQYNDRAYTCLLYTSRCV